MYCLASVFYVCVSEFCLFIATNIESVRLLFRGAFCIGISCMLLTADSFLRKRLYMLLSVCFSSSLILLCITRYTETLGKTEYCKLTFSLCVINVQILAHTFKLNIYLEYKYFGSFFQSPSVSVLFLQPCCHILVFLFVFFIIIIIFAICRRLSWCYCVFFFAFFHFLLRVALQKLRDACIRVMYVCVYFLFVRSFILLTLSYG